MSLFNRLLINAVSIYLAKILEGLLQLAVLAFILSQVSKEYYAAALLIISIQATIDLARGGMQKATLKYISEYKANGDIAGACGVLSSSSVMQGAVGLLGLIVCLCIAPFSTSLFSLPDYMQQEAQWASILLGLGIFVSFAISPWYNSVAAQERYDLQALATVFGKVFRAVLVVILLLNNAPALISLVLATVAGGLAERLICISFVKKISPDLTFVFKKVGISYVKVMLKFSVFDFFHTLSGLLYSQGSLYLAAHFISLDAVAGLGIIANITSLVGLVTNQVAQMLVPVASRLKAQNEDEKLKDLIVRGTTITVFAGGMVLVGILPWVESLLVVWLGQPYAAFAAPAAVMITATFFVNSVTCLHNSLGGVGKVAVDGVSNTVCTIIGLTIGVILVNWVNLGLLGLAIGLLSARIFRLIFLSWYGGITFGLHMLDFFWKGYSRSFLLMSVIAFAGLNVDLAIQSWPLLFCAGGITAALYFIIGTLWIIDPADRSRFVRATFDGWRYLNSSR